MILLAAFLIRAAGLHFGLPITAHQDEPIIVNHALAYASLDFNPHFFKIPPLVSYLLFLAYVIFYAIMALFAGMSQNEFAALFFRDPTAFYLTGRAIFGAALGTASVYLVYVIGKKTLGRAAAVSAMALFAVDYLHVRDSHYLYVDIPMTFAMLVCFTFLLKHDEHGEPRSLLAAGVWMGIAVAFKYTAVPLAVPLLMVCGLRAGGHRAFFIHATQAVLVSALVYFLLNPFSLLDWRFFLSQIQEQAASESRMPFWHHLRYSLFGGQSAAAICLAIAGMAALCAARIDKSWLISFPVVYYLMITIFSQPYERYAMPLVPFVCLFAGYLIVRIGDAAGAGRRWVIVALTAAVAAVPLSKSIYLDTLLVKPDTRALLREWILQKVPEGDGVIVDHAFFSPRLEQTDEQLAEKEAAIDPADPHAASKRKKIALLREAGKGRNRYRVFYLDEYALGKTPFLMWSPLVAADVSAVRATGARHFVRYRYPGERDFSQQLASRSQLKAVFSPYRDPKKTMNEDPWANTAHPFEGRELFSRKFQGPYLEIYELSS